MRKKIILLSILAILVCAVLIAALFHPAPILDDSEEIFYLWITYNPSYGMQETSDFIEISDYNQDEVLNCLSKYNETLTLERSYSYSLNDVELEIMIYSEKGLKQIRMGDINEVSYGYGSFLRTIEQGDFLRKELKDILNLAK